jgi:5-methylcytosine-specific restriction endonuclease McrA
MSKRTANPTYRKNRAQLLRDQPNCHWCKKAKATQADHLIEADRGGTDDLDNMVASCGRCNAKRGQAYGTAKARARQAKRPNVPTATRTKKIKPKPLLDSTPPCLPPCHLSY